MNHTNQPPVLLYLAYGRKMILQQAVFSILTLYHQLQGKFDAFRCVVYTDNPSFFNQHLKDIPVSTEVITKDVLRQYKGPHNFHLRTKICVLQACFAKYKSDLFFCDTDTVFFQSPVALMEKVSESVSVMNANEYDLYDAGNYEETNWLTIRKIIRQHKFTLQGKEFAIPFSTRMWNSGVIGLSYKNRELTEEMLSLCDQLYSKAPFFLAEQFAISYVLQNRTSLLSSEGFILHYWADKVGLNYHLGIFFKEQAKEPLPARAEKAVALAKQYKELQAPQPNLLQTTVLRLKMSAKIILTGRV